MTALQKLGFFATPAHRCNYLPDHKAVTLFADPGFPKSARLFTALADCGFRRSGKHLYIPHCPGCNSCISVRVPVSEFRPSRIQRRTCKKNSDLVISKLPPRFNEAHFNLYKTYLCTRHPEGGMDYPTPENYMDFLTAGWAETVFYEMRLDGKVIAVAVADILDNAMSAVYTFFHPGFSNRSLGRFAILHEIAQAKEAGFTWLYLGYWISECQKMKYKNEYRPIEYYVDNQWQRDCQRSGPEVVKTKKAGFVSRLEKPLQ